EDHDDDGELNPEASELGARYAFARMHEPVVLGLRVDRLLRSRSRWLVQSASCRRSKLGLVKFFSSSGPRVQIGCPKTDFDGLVRLITDVTEVTVSSSLAVNTSC